MAGDSERQSKKALIAGGFLLVVVLGAGIAYCARGPIGDERVAQLAGDALEERERLMGSEATDAVRTGRNYQWEIVGRTQLGRTVYLEPSGFDDACFFADVLHKAQATAYEGRSIKILFFDDRAATPTDLKLSEKQKTHLRASYAYNQSNGRSSFVRYTYDEGKRVTRRAPSPRPCP